MPALHMTLLGGFEARLASGETLALRGRKTQALLAYLDFSPGVSLTRKELSGPLWGDRGEEQAGASLRQARSELRKALVEAGDSLLTADRDSVALKAEAVDVDVGAF